MRLGKVIEGFLWTDIGLSAVLIANILIVNIAGAGEAFLLFDALISLILGMVSITYTILYLVWLFKIHKHLQQVDSSYPITPGGALARVMIPLYNLYGIWNVYSTMARYFKDRFSTNNLGARLAGFVPVLYLLIFPTSILNTVLSGQPAEQSYSTWWFISYIGDIALVIMYILIVKTVSAGLKKLSTGMANDPVGQTSLPQ
ncbi:hypothetical protein D3H55_21940 [Bacillus salacetis]|uniref:DUF4328 domain-containing protein n=1 Tax=Bacillus salacetis TaxID=2315464 RepID=A0A3A1QN08_9BACI|nr:hypothetical protein [Bacillus salacetis]RIW28458.1 hypothetical protein D3H55_21940 [Bacillus salacetis]